MKVEREIGGMRKDGENSPRTGRRISLFEAKGNFYSREKNVLENEQEGKNLAEKLSSIA